MRFGKSSKAAKAVSVALAMLLTASMSVAAFGACVTTTTYDATTGLALVKSEITGALADSEVTYVAKAGETIVYLDQATADGEGKVTFEYATNAATVANVTYAAKEEADADYAKANGGTIKLDKYTVTYKCDENRGTVSAATEAYKGQNVVFTLEPNAGFKTSAVSVNGKEATSLIGNTYTLEVTENADVVFYFEPVASELGITNAQNDGITGYVGNAVQCFATVSIPESMKDSAVPYGVLFTIDEDVEMTYGAKGVYDLQALGNVDGNFIIKVVLGEEEISKARMLPYVFDGEDYIFGTEVEVTIQ